VRGETMKKKIFVLVVLLLILSVSIAVYAETVTCPIDGSGAYFTGNTKTDVSGHLLWEYKCNQFGHLFWVVKS
jgi:hypothetical protein